ncbi:MAG: cytidylate kinase, partial [Burkholderiaceae bacterium]|nr:cytidylate kinase [Burkholderiaceae bacterium]
MNQPPVIAIDGPTASGKGTVAMHVANHLGFHYLDSGALYRLVALASQQKGISPSDYRALGELALTMQIEFKNGLVFLGNLDVTEAIRNESIGVLASQIAVVNKQMSKHPLASRQPPDLLDQRDLLLTKLSRLTKINVTTMQNGAVDISVGTIASAGKLVVGDRSTPLMANFDERDLSRVAIILDPYAKLP